LRFGIKLLKEREKNKKEEKMINKKPPEFNRRLYNAVAILQEIIV